ncbi:hypothetical protein MCOR25_010909 [Pyricularia grisea]|uniref:Uncharacterized protein n=1 Tax=Pyricularia grisea TaxID=148305 RepID=A0A6P8B1U2_PYRGI|nr:uncharacterized protein PgNI_07945 [Pyricularia grisea]KAI6347390.1 hypothetical protein MCOR25_010909 [Pyricularia grisea]TLD08688.1 hypothetical protein PgNI_07945 [Pyricularia grisea]
MAHISCSIGMHVNIWGNYCIFYGQCKSVDDRAEFAGSYGVNRGHISTVLPTRSSNPEAHITMGPEDYSTQTDVTSFPSRLLVTSIAVTITQTYFAEVDITPRSYGSSMKF